MRRRAPKQTEDEATQVDTRTGYQVAQPHGAQALFDISNLGAGEHGDEDPEASERQGNKALQPPLVPVEAPSVEHQVLFRRGVAATLRYQRDKTAPGPRSVVVRYAHHEHGGKSYQVDDVARVVDL